MIRFCSFAGCALSNFTEEEAGFSSRMLAGPLTIVLGLVALIQLGSWIPHYLTWPYWADHDVFANAARAWDLGERPYRDVSLNNFPGTIYLFYALGKLGGWGRPWSFYAFDAGLLSTLVILWLAWSRRTFGYFLPGLIGSLAFLSYYLSLDYCHAAQRDWQGPCFLVLALLIAQGWPGRVSRVASACLAALALSIRPQTVLLWPALLLAVIGEEEPGERSKVRRALIWLGTLGAFVALAFLPLVLNGVLGDFFKSLRHVTYGSTYNRVGPVSLAKGWLLQASAFRWLVVPSGILLLGRTSEPKAWRAARAWLLALAGISLYKPISPMAHSYLDIPLVLVWSVNLAVLAGLILSTPVAPSTLKLVGVLGLLGMGATTARPDFCVVGPNLRAFATLRSGVESEPAPPGYRIGPVGSSAFYPWSDYRATMLYLRGHTRPTTRVANVLKGDPAIVSAVDRPSVFPAESIAWLRMVNKDDEASFVGSLEKAADSVVLWSPGEVGPDPLFQVNCLEAAIRRLYQFETRFGAIEIWRRQGQSAQP